MILLNLWFICGANMDEIKINNHNIKITHPDKILFPNVEVTKNDLIEYYLKIADQMLPYLKDRAITIRCFPDGLGAPGFFRQRAQVNLPDWFETVTLRMKDGREMVHMLCQNKETLLYLANQNMIEIHRWLSKIYTPEIPDIMIIDIDTPENRFDLVVKAAKLLKTLLENKGFEVSPMLTGSKGLHLTSILSKREGFEEVRIMVHELAAQLVAKYPDEFSTELRKEMRKGRVYIDISRNSYGQTSITPFSPRALQNVPVATPISWGELDSPDVKSNSYNIWNIFDRLRK